MGAMESHGVVMFRVSTGTIHRPETGSEVVNDGLDLRHL